MRLPLGGLECTNNLQGGEWHVARVGVVRSELEVIFLWSRSREVKVRSNVGGVGVVRSE